MDSTTLASKIEEELSLLDFSREPKDLYEPITYILSLGGKRIRPVLLLMACEMFGESIEKGIPQALAIEIFHNFTLVHDDIMDKAPKRRNQLTVHTKWNENTGILSGDVMLVCAYKQLCKSEPQHLEKLLELFNQTAIEVCEGQQFDMNYELESTVTISEYIRMIELKTAVLLGCSLQTGAIVSGASEQDQKNIYEFGRNMGIAFQLQDDLLDAFGNPDKFGKQVGGDIISNKKTYLFLKALELANDDQRHRLTQLFSETTFDSTKKIEEVKQLFIDLGIPNETKQEIAKYSDASLSYLQKITVAQDQKATLEDLARKLMIREY